MLRFMASAAILILLTIPATARSTPYRGDVQEFCGDRYCGTRSIDIKPRRQDAPTPRCSGHGCREAKASRKRIQGHDTQIVARPTECPTRAYCGCASSIKVFGRPIRDLYLAANWLKFPRAEAAPGMVAARHGHVFVIQEVLGNNMVLAYDPNSGQHLTRIHVRSLAGFKVVNPGVRFAQN